MRNVIYSFIGLVVISSATLRGADAVRTEDTPRNLVLDNGVIRLTVSKDTAQITSIQRYNRARQLQELGSGRDSMYWDANTEPTEIPASIPTPPKKGYARISPIKSIVAKAFDDRAEIIVIGGPNDWMTFEVEYHWVLFAADSGWYSYVVIRHPENLPAMTFYQSRFVIKTTTDGTFKTQITGEDRSTSIPTAQAVAKLMDATYLMPDGTINTKYSNSVYWAEAPVYGQVGNQIGIWNLSSSFEYHNGGPVKQGQTVHDNVLLRVLQSVHFGASPVKVSKGEAFSKVYGPFFTYINSADTPEAMLKDAMDRQKQELAKWPYDFVTVPEYSHERGTVSGKWHLKDSQTPSGAMVVLAQPGADWPAQGKGYQYWTRTTDDGKFTIKNVSPGEYNLYIYGGDQPTQYQSPKPFIVEANKTVQLGDIEWAPEIFGKTFWQIGVFDRTATEFKDGADSRQFQPYLRYPKSFPNDVDFTIGKSDPSKDWNYAQWIWYSKSPEWKIRFNQPASIKGRWTLTFGISSAQPLNGKTTNLKVKLNDKPIGAIELGKTGTSGYRGGAADSQYNIVRMTFDAADLITGENKITLAHEDAIPFSEVKPMQEQEAETDTAGFKVGHVMYDAIRLQIAE